LLSVVLHMINRKFFILYNDSFLFKYLKISS